MKVLRQLIQDAQTVLRDMSVTQRVAVVSLILAVAAWFTIAAFLGSRAEGPSEAPLPIRVEITEYREIEDALKKQGFSPRYNAEEKAIFVPAGQRDDAYIYLVSDRIVTEGNLNRTTLDQMVERISFTDTTLAVTSRERVARGNSVANLIAKFDVISEADVIYSDDKRGSLFLASAPLSASVLVKTKYNRPLDEGTAQTIITLVALSKSGLKPDNVVVTDRGTAREFRNQDRNSIAALATTRIELERVYAEEARQKIEALVRRRIPNLGEGGAVTVIPTYSINADLVDKRQLIKEDGVAVRKRSHTEKRRDVEGPPYEPGVQPGVGTSSRVDAENAGRNGLVHRESSHDIKTQETEIAPSETRIATKPAPRPENVTLSVLIQLPYELERDEEGNIIPDVNEYGETILDPDTRKPRPRRKSVEPLSEDELRKLTNALAIAVQIPADQIAEKVFVDQVPWRAPVYSEPGAEPSVTLILRFLENKGFAILIAALMGVALLAVFQQARQQVKTTIAGDEDELDEFDVRESLAAEVPEEDPAQVEMEATRMRVREAVLEDPVRASLLVHRWLTKEG